MIIKCGIIGLPNIGKSTLFNSVTKQNVKNENYPFCTIKPNIGHSFLYNKKIKKIIKFSKSKESILPKILYIDIAGLIENAHKGTGLGNYFLEDIKKVNIIIHIIRIFKNPKIINIYKNINPINNLNIIRDEMIFFDLILLEKLRSKFNKNNKYKNLINLCIKKLEKRKFINFNTLNIKEKKIIKKFNLLTNKKNIYLLNIDKKNKCQNKINKIKKYINNIEHKPTIISLNIKKYFHISPKKKINKFNKIIIKKLNFINFFTFTEKKIGLWLTKKKNNIIKSIKQIHNDFVKKFIKVQIINFKKFIKYKGWIKSKQLGKIKIKGKKYILKHNDVIQIMINKK